MKCVNNSNGRNKRTAKILKKSWSIAPAIAFENSLRRRRWPNETIVFVTVVPILAPMRIGIAPVIEIDPLATNPTRIEVVLDEL